MAEQKQIPGYAWEKGVYGTVAYKELTLLCRMCGCTVAYDGAPDEPDSTVIHMGLDADYADSAQAHFDLARKLAWRLFRKAQKQPQILAEYGLPPAQAAGQITEEMIVNTWAKMIEQYVIACEDRALRY